MTFLIGFILFLFASIFSFYIPGRVVVFKWFPNIKGLEQKVLSFSLGISLFLLSAYMLAWFEFPMLQYGLILLFVIIYALFILKKDSVALNNVDVRLLVLVVLGSLTAILLTAFSGVLTDVGWRYTGFNAADGIVHIARIKNQIASFPPTHPGLAGIDFRGYHYFYDFLISRFVLLFNMSPEHLYFRYFSFLSAFIYGVGLIAFSKKITSKFWAICLIILFGYFGTGGAFILEILQPEFRANVSQSLYLIYDPSIYFSLGILFSVLIIFPHINSWSRVLLASVILGVLAQIKIYVGLLGIAALVVYTAYYFFKYKRKNIKYYIGVNIVTALITAVTFLPNNLGAGQMVFAPFLFYSHFIQQPYFADWNWEIKRQIFADHNNYLRIIILYIQAFFVFWLFILEFKILTVFNIKKLFTKKFWTHDYNFLLVIVISTAFLMPTFFIQSISVFDIGQFFWILLMLFSIPLGVTLWSLIEKYKRIGIFATFTIVAFSIIGALYLLVLAHSAQGVITDKDESRLLSQASKRVHNDQFIVVVPEINNKELIWRGHSLITALTGKSVYYEDQIITYALGDVYTQRKQNLLDLHTSLTLCDIQTIQNILTRIGSKSIISYAHYPCLEDENIVTYADHATDLHFYILK